MSRSVILAVSSEALAQVPVERKPPDTTCHSPTLPYRSNFAIIHQNPLHDTNPFYFLVSGTHFNLPRLRPVPEKCGERLHRRDGAGGSKGAEQEQKAAVVQTTSV